MTTPWFVNTLVRCSSNVAMSAYLLLRVTFGCRQELESYLERHSGERYDGPTTGSSTDMKQDSIVFRRRRGSSVRVYTLVTTLAKVSVLYCHCKHRIHITNRSRSNMFERLIEDFDLQKISKDSISLKSKTGYNYNLSLASVFPPILHTTLTGPDRPLPPQANVIKASEEFTVPLPSSLKHDKISKIITFELADGKKVTLDYSSDVHLRVTESLVDEDGDQQDERLVFGTVPRRGYVLGEHGIIRYSRERHWVRSLRSIRGDHADKDTHSRSYRAAFRVDGNRCRGLRRIFDRSGRFSTHLLRDLFNLANCRNVK
jgi:hypothetical protein